MKSYTYQGFTLLINEDCSTDVFDKDMCHIGAWDTEEQARAFLNSIIA